MRINVLTLFPQMFAPLSESIMKRAQNKGLAEIDVQDIRAYTTDKHHITDEPPYGGGAGMVMKPEPIFAAVEAVRRPDCRPRVILTSPRGRLFTQELAEELAKEEQLIFICGHYEGVDERVEQLLATDVLSVGDFVLTGGELPCMCMVDAVVRLLPGVLGDDHSAEEESFSHDGLLEYPQYTRPSEYAGLSVPEVLLSGNHAEIAKWRRQEALRMTYLRRPELLPAADLDHTDAAYLQALRQAHERPFRFFVALLHYPVYNKNGEVINTSVTNLDMHDIVRAAATYAVDGFFLVQPAEAQRQLMQTLAAHWLQGYGARYNKDRKRAMEKLRIVPSLEEVMAELQTADGEAPRLIGTTAKRRQGMCSFHALRQRLSAEGGSWLLLLGTGWGLTEETLTACDCVLRPIYGRGDYNHLSVRSAASIVLDRLLGERGTEEG